MRRWPEAIAAALGHDGEMRVWSGIDDDDCEDFLVGEEGFAVAAATNR